MCKSVKINFVNFNLYIRFVKIYLKSTNQFKIDIISNVCDSTYNFISVS